MSKKKCVKNRQFWANRWYLDFRKNSFSSLLDTGSNNYSCSPGLGEIRNIFYREVNSECSFFLFLFIQCSCAEGSERENLLFTILILKLFECFSNGQTSAIGRKFYPSPPPFKITRFDLNLNFTRGKSPWTFFRSLLNPSEVTSRGVSNAPYY